MGYLLTQMSMYILGAFLLGLLLGWILWGYLRGRINDLEAECARLRAEVDRLKAELDACGRARAELERRLREAEAALASARARPAPAAAAQQAPAQLISTPAAQPKPATARPAAAKPAVQRATPAPRKPAAPAKPDNLRRMIGIGPVNERKLRELGVTTFAQIAAWKAADIKRVEEVLEFDGRIERERWIEQAKYLAKGDEKGFLKAFPNADSENNT